MFLEKGNPDEAEFRLRDILVEEVSIVDRAANRRRFLVVKQQGGNMADIKKTDDQAVDAEAPASSESPTDAVTMAAMPSAVKEGVLRILTEVLERLVSVSNQVKDAEETSASSDNPLDPTLAGEIKNISELLGGVLSRYPSPVAKAPPCGSADDEEEKDKINKAEGVLSQGLRSVGEQAMSLAGQCAESQELDASCIKNVRQLAIMLNQLVEKYPSPTAGAEGVAKVEEAGMDETTVSHENKAEDTPTTAAVLSALGTEFADKMKVMAEVINHIAEAPSPEALTELRERLMNVTKSLEPAEGATPTDAQKSMYEQLSAAVAAMEKRIDALMAQIDKRATAAEPLPPEHAAGELPNVGTSGPTEDKPAVQGEGELAAVMKRMDSMQNELQKLAATPQVPASRSEPTGTTKPRDRRGIRTPWIM